MVFGGLRLLLSGGLPLRSSASDAVLVRWRDVHGLLLSEQQHDDFDDAFSVLFVLYEHDFEHDDDERAVRRELQVAGVFGWFVVVDYESLRR